MYQIPQEWLESGFSLDDEFTFPVPKAETDGFAQICGDAEFGLLDEDTMQNFDIDLMGVDDFESFI